jgi:hypothetical protein
LIEMAEGEGARRGSVHGAFPSARFYLRQGYEVLGRLDLDPLGHTRFILT